MGSEKLRQLDHLRRRRLLDQQAQLDRRQKLLVFRLAAAEAGNQATDAGRRNLPSDPGQGRRKGQQWFQPRRILRLERAQSPAVLGRARNSAFIGIEPILLVHWLSDHRQYPSRAASAPALTSLQRSRSSGQNGPKMRVAAAAGIAERGASILAAMRPAVLLDRLRFCERSAWSGSVDWAARCASGAGWP